MHATTFPDGPRLLADIGGTNARFALDHGGGSIGNIAILACSDYADITAAIRTYLQCCPDMPIRNAIVAIANPVTGDIVRMTNHHWEFSINAVQRALGLDLLLVVNDFTALAMSVPTLAPTELEKIGGGTARNNGVIGLVGAGTGLGVAGLIPSSGRWLALESEGGHVAFSPSDERELTVLKYCWQHYDHVSAERLVSGPGIELIHKALAQQANRSEEKQLTTAAIVADALQAGDPLCQATIECFCGMLGTVSANLAVTLCAQGGIYIGGGVVPRLGGYFAKSPFRSRFEKKGRFSAFNAEIPTYVITAPYPAFTGVARILSDHLGDNGEQAMPIATRQRAMRASSGCAI